MSEGTFSAVAVNMVRVKADAKFFLTFDFRALISTSETNDISSVYAVEANCLQMKSNPLPTVLSNSVYNHFCVQSSDKFCFSITEHLPLILIGSLLC